MSTRGSQRRRAIADSHSAPEKIPFAKILPHVSPFASDADWAQVANKLQTLVAEAHPQIRHHIYDAIRAHEAELEAQTKRRRICEHDLDPGMRLRPNVILAFDARIHRLGRRIDQLKLLLAGKAPRERAHVAQLRDKSRLADMEERENYVRAMLGQAVWVIRKSRLPKFGFPGNYRTCLPDPVRDFWEAYNALEIPEATRQLPSAHQLSQCDSVIHWFFWVEDIDERNVLFLRHVPLSWRKVAMFVGVSHTQAMLMERDAVRQIIEHIGRQSVA